MVSPVVQVISTLVPFFVVIITITVILYFVLNPNKRRCCRSTKVTPESNGDVTQAKNPDEQDTADRKDTDDITAPPEQRRRKKSVTFKLTRVRNLITADLDTEQLCTAFLNDRAESAFLQYKAQRTALWRSFLVACGISSGLSEWAVNSREFVVIVSYHL
jgi:hypothetical protein